MSTPAPDHAALIARLRKLAHWEVGDDVQALRTRLACIGAACADALAALRGATPAEKVDRLALIGEAVRDPSLSDFACRIAVGAIVNGDKPLTPDDIAWGQAIAAKMAPPEATE